MDWVLVTGGTRGLGLAVSKRLVFQGFKVVAMGRSLTDELKTEICNSNGMLEFECFDLSQTANIHECVTGLCKKHGAPFGLVNNAAIGLDGVLGTQHEKDIEQLISVNLLSPILLTKYMSRQMMLKRRGRVINISSVTAITGYSGLAVYAATKAGLLGFTKSLSRELGKVGITVNAVCPGFLETKMSEGLQGDKLASIVRRSPLGRLATVDDVAGAVLFLMGNDGNSVSGSIVTVDAGNTA